MRVDGQLLEPEVQLMLRLVELLEQTSLEKQTVEEARRTTREEAALFGPRVPLEMGRVEDLVLGAGPPARLYVPLGAPDPCPLLVYFHGGGFVCGDLDTHDSTARFLAHNAGLRVLSVDYRLAPEHPFPAPIEDGLAALGFAFQNAERLGADPGAIAVGGDSAGGNLAAAVAQLARDGGHAPAYQLLLYPVTDWSRKTVSYRLFHEGLFLTEADMDWYKRHFLGGDVQAALDPRASPLLAEDLTGVAPACVVIAGFDPLRDEGIAYARRLEEAGVPTTLKVFWGMVHGFANATGVGRCSGPAMKQAAESLRDGLAAA
jgi:acetyl esterase/lipase